MELTTRNKQVGATFPDTKLYTAATMTPMGATTEKAKTVGQSKPMTLIFSTIWKVTEFLKLKTKHLGTKGVDTVFRSFVFFVTVLLENCHSLIFIGLFWGSCKFCKSTISNVFFLFPTSKLRGNKDLSNLQWINSLLPNSTVLWLGILLPD